ncbi:rubredoxin-like domain-containing protein [Desulfolucanica intricata]|uniref:rubredoxin-like domain-containing protein n=1 Tax=Desulfolucanica intricata TaxID=1285191 RepID=UPI00082F57D1|nr:hypothetical protein [Desulfolucanica intricata]
MWKCICGYVIDNVPEKCPHCGAPANKFNQLTENEMKLILNSRATNDIHTELLVLLDNAITLCEKGIELNLDAGCADVFHGIKEYAVINRQNIKAELAGHVSKNKWG